VARRGTRSVLATAVGYVLVALVVYILLRFVIGTLFWLVRTVVVIVVIGGLFVLYLRLKSPRD
jgi:threonine/homoserine/homoserine lactone efflux protein